MDRCAVSLLLIACLVAGCVTTPVRYRIDRPDDPRARSCVQRCRRQTHSDPAFSQCFRQCPGVVVDRGGACPRTETACVVVGQDWHAMAVWGTLAAVITVLVLFIASDPLNSDEPLFGSPH